MLQRYTGRALASTPIEKSGQLNFEVDSSATDSIERFGSEALAISYLGDPLSDALISQGGEKLYREVELPLIRVLARMEHVGVGVDVDRLQRINDRLRGEVDRLTAELYEVSGRSFNLNSPKQLSEILYTERGLTPPRKTKTGYSTDATTLELLNTISLEFIEPLLQYREFEAAFTRRGSSAVSRRTIHVTFNQTVARTGRLSSDQPNLHNIPVRNAEGEVSTGIHRPRTCCWSLITKLNCVARPSGQRSGLIGSSTVDIHTGSPPACLVSSRDVTYEQRSQAKMVSYGLAYDGVIWTESATYRVSQRPKFDAYLMPSCEDYMDAIVAEACKRVPRRCLTLAPDSGVASKFQNSTGR